MNKENDKNNNQDCSNQENNNKTNSIITNVVFILIMFFFTSFAILLFIEEGKTSTNKLELKKRQENIISQPPKGIRPQPPQDIPQAPKIFGLFRNTSLQGAKTTIVRKPQNTIPTHNNNQSSSFKKNKSIYSFYKLNEQQLRSEIDDYINGRTDYNCSDKAIQKEFIYTFVQMNYVNLLDKLLTEASEKNILVKDKDFYSDVFETLENNHIECFKVFAKHGLDGLKDLDKNNIDNKIIHLAASKGITSIVKQALDNGFPINKRTELNETPLYLAIHNNHYETVEFLINNGALTSQRLEEYNNYGNILYYPVINKNLKMLDLLVRNGILLNDNLRTYTNDRKILKYIISNGKIENDNDANDQDKEWEEAYKYIKEGNLNELIKLENSGKDLSKMYYDGVPAICIAVEQNKPQIVEHLVKKYDCKKLKDSINGRNALHYAAMNTKDIYVENLKILLKNGFDPNEPDNDKNTPINFAVCCNHFIPNTAFLLLEKGANPNLLNNKNQNSLFFVIENSYVNRFNDLLKYGADINQQDIDGNTPSHHYLLKSPERNKTMGGFLGNKTNIKLVNNKKQTLLHIAIYSNDSIAACVLLMRNENINQQDIDGNTGLHYVAKYASNNKNMMKQIYNNSFEKPNFSIKNNEGKTPLDIEPNCFYQSEFKDRLPVKE